MNKSLDHLVHLVTDLPRSASIFSQIGFNVRPIEKHIDLGSSNCVIQFANTYYELVDLSNGVAWVAAPYKERLKFGEGLAHVSLNSENLPKDWARLSSLGLAPEEIISARRKITMPDGTQDETDSDCFYVWREDNPYLSLFLSAHHKPETIFVPEYQVHPNGATEVKRVVFLSSTLASDRSYFIKHYGREPNILFENGFIMTGEHSDKAEVLGEPVFSKKYGSLCRCDTGSLKGLPKITEFQVSDIEQTKRFLEQNNVPLILFEEGVAIHENNASGCALIFKQDYPNF